MVNAEELGSLDGLMSGNPLDKDSIESLIQGSSPLIEDFLSLENQLQPNGFDITLREVGCLTSAGSIDAGTGERELSATEIMDFDSDDRLHLNPGPYLITFNEVVNLPLDLMALGRPRSSLLRSGVSVHTAVWDAGYHGRSQALLVVHQSSGYRLQRGGPVDTVDFFPLTPTGQPGVSRPLPRREPWVKPDRI